MWIFCPDMFRKRLKNEQPSTPRIAEKLCELTAALN
jgi:hypothetical protein